MRAGSAPIAPPAARNNPNIQARPSAPPPLKAGSESMTASLAIAPKPVPKTKSNDVIVMAGIAAVAFVGFVFCVGAGVAFWYFTSARKSEVRAEAARAVANVQELPPPPRANQPLQPEGNPARDVRAVAAPPEQAMSASEVVQHTKAATVFIKAETPQSLATGSGFVLFVQAGFAYVATNHHVIAPQVLEQETKGPPQKFGGPPIGGLPGKLGPRLPSAPLLKRQTVLQPQLSVVFHSGTTKEFAAKAELVADEPDFDLAILKIASAKNLPSALDTSKKAELFETMPVLIFGFPFGQALALDRGNPAITVGKGGVSSIRLDDSGELALVQIDGDLNPGNSGGPIVDSAGRLVGVAVAKIKGTQIGLAIPASDLDKLIAGRTASVRIARRMVGQNVVNHVGEIWTIDLRHRIKNSKFLQELAPDEEQNLRPDAAVAEIVVEANLFDPMAKVTGATLHYLKADLLQKLPLADKKGIWPPLAGAQKIAMEIKNHQGTAALKLPATNRADSYFFQVSYHNGQGQTFYTQPRKFALERGSTQVAQQPAAPDAGVAAPKAKVRLPPRPSYTPPAPTETITEADAGRFIADLKSADQEIRKFTAERLAKTKPEVRRDEVSKALVAQLTDNDIFVRGALVKAIWIWGTAENIPDLMALFDHKDIFVRAQSMEAAAGLKDTRTAEPIAAHLTSGFDRGAAGKALKIIGPKAEAAALKYLDHTDPWVRREVCLVLREIGTQASAAALENATRDSNQMVANEARKALAMVNGN
jgi:S1-C subfamily serine protease